MREYEIPAMDGVPASGATTNALLNTSGAGNSGVTINADGYIVLPEI
jgi:hypothetical protein